MLVTCGSNHWKNVEAITGRMWKQSLEECGSNHWKNVEAFTGRMWKQSLEECGSNHCLVLSSQDENFGHITFFVSKPKFSFSTPYIKIACIMKTLGEVKFQC
jgi:triosephosphate isomerase